MKQTWQAPYLFLKVLLLHTIFFGACHTYAEDDFVITLWSRNFDTAHVDKVLKLALEKTEDLFPPVIIRRSAPIEYQEAINSLLAGDGTITILSAASSIENDANFQTIRFPAFKGLLGYRICLIRKGEQKYFNNIVTMHDFTLNDLKVCQAESWPDTNILKRNGAPLLTSTTYRHSFENLINGRCDCFLRGAQEILPEYNNHKTELDIETSFVVNYPQPGLLYVNKKDSEWAARIELGLLRALDDGSYNQLFNALMGDSLEELDLPHRKVIKLANPSPSSTNTEIQKIPELWY